MCSIDPDEVTEMIKDVFIISDICRKCKSSNSNIILRHNETYCKSCFKVYFTHKFRSTIGKSKQIRPGDKILIAYSGGKNSTALLHLIHEGLKESVHKKFRFAPSFIFIDEIVLDDTSQSIDVCAQVTDLDLPCFYVKLEEVFNTDEISIAKYENRNSKINRQDKSNYEDRLKKFVSKVNSTTSYQDLLTQMRNELLCRCAKKLGIQKVFLAENGTTLSVKILSDVALGRGAQLADRVHFKTRIWDIEVYRPMRELLQDEIDYYLSILNISVLLPINPDKDAPSIFQCTEDFILSLQKDFSSTIPTILKTGSKLVNNNHRDDDCLVEEIRSQTSEGEEISFQTSEGEEIRSQTSEGEEIRFQTSEGEEIGSRRSEGGGPTCTFCSLTLDTREKSASAIQAVNVSRLMSSLQPSQMLFSRINGHPLGSTGSDHSVEELRNKLCYGCRNLFIDLVRI